MIFLFSPRYAYGIAKWLRMVLSWALPPLLLYTVYLICTAPLDQVQGWTYLWIYLHVPAAWISLFAGVVMGGLNTLAWIYHLHVANILAHQSAKIGLAATLVALMTGSIWGSMTWGTWWIWDMRLTTELLLALLYIAYLTAVHAVQIRLLSKRIQF